MVMIGESAFAGVGVEKHQDGFAGSLAYNLSERLPSSVNWTVYAKSGYTAQKLSERLIPKIEE